MYTYMNYFVSKYRLAQSIFLPVVPKRDKKKRKQLVFLRIYEKPWNPYIYDSAWQFL